MLHTKFLEIVPLVPGKKSFKAGNKLEGDWGKIVALGAEISPLKEPREKWSLPKKIFIYFFFFFFFFF